MFIISPVLYYIGNLEDIDLKNLNNKNIDIAFNFILLLSLLIPFIVRINFLTKNIMAYTNRDWINITHYVIFISLFLYIGITARNLHSIFIYISLLLSQSIFSIHSFHLIKKFPY